MATRPAGDVRRQQDSQADRLARSRRPEDASAAQRTAASPALAEEGLIKPNHGVQEIELPPGFIIRRVIVGLAFYASWLPYIVLIAAREKNLQDALIFGVAWSGFCVFFHLGLRLLKQKREWPYILDGAFLVFFVVYLPVYMRYDYQQRMMQWELVVLHLWLFLVLVGTVAARYPFTSQYAREEAPEEAWNAESFKSVCDHIAGVWAGSTGLTGLLCLAPAITGRYQGKDGLNVMFNYVWPLGSFLLLLLGTRIWPGMIRRLYYLPRMLKATVKPDNGANGASTDNANSNNSTQQGQGQAGKASAQGPNQASSGQPAGQSGSSGATGMSGREGTRPGFSSSGAASVPAGPSRAYPAVPVR